MEINKRRQQILWVSIAAISVGAMVGIMYANMYKLSKPVFTESYMEIEMPEIVMYDNESNTKVELNADGLYYPLDMGLGTSDMGIKPGNDRLIEEVTEDFEFELNYITNINDSLRVSYIVFDEAPELNTYVREIDSYGWESGIHYAGYDDEKGILCGRYSVRTMQITIEGDQAKNIFSDLIKNNKSLELNHATIYAYRNDKRIKFEKVNLGRIILMPTKKAENILEKSEYTGISRNTRRETIEKYMVKKAVRIVSVNSPLLEKMQDSIEIKIGNTSYEDAAGLQFNEGDLVTIHGWAKRPKSIKSGYFGYQMLPVVTFEDEEGKLYEQQISNMDYSGTDCKYLSKDIRLYLKGRGVI